MIRAFCLSVMNLSGLRLTASSFGRRVVRRKRDDLFYMGVLVVPNFDAIRQVVIVRSHKASLEQNRNYVNGAAGRSGDVILGPHPAFCR